MVFNKKMRYISLFIFMMALMSSIFFGFDQQGNIFKQRRKKLASMVEEGIIIIQSTENNQRNLYEFFVPNSDNHDFTYLTGLETANATLILCPGSEEYPEILYIQGDHEKIKKVMIFPMPILIFPCLDTHKGSGSPSPLKFREYYTTVVRRRLFTLIFSVLSTLPRSLLKDLGLSIESSASHRNMRLEMLQTFWIV